MNIELKWQGKKFSPYLYRQKKNYSLSVEQKMVEIIKEEAFFKNWKLSLVGEAIIKATLSSGVCSGISASILLNFLEEERSSQDELNIAIMQVRTWGRPFLSRSIKGFLNPKGFREELTRALLNAFWKNLPLLVFLPKGNNLHKIAYAHTVIPYSLEEGLSSIKIRVFDSNYPEKDNLVLKVNKFDGNWNYGEKNSKKWVLTVNYLGNLLKKVPFLW